MNHDPLKVLLVDDTPENLVALQALLRRTDVELVLARSGNEALEQCLVHELALALVDVQMPEMDGFELAELMRGAERTRHVPIIFVTAGARDHARMFRGYELGAVDYLYKPVDTQVLTGKVNVFLELAAHRRQLAHALQLNELFVAILGHDLRNPLAAMTSGIDLLSMTSKDPAQQSVLARMRRSGARMQAMIRDLLDLSHARLAGGLGLARNREPVDVSEVLASAVEEVRAGREREIVVAGGGAPPVRGDRERLLQLLSNLLANAVAHGAEGTTVTARVTSSAEHVDVEIHNFGAIPDDVRTRLFEPFHRARGAQAQGLGLGLYIARQIALAHGGDVLVRSRDPEGTTFTVRLPRAGGTTPQPPTPRGVETRPG